MQEKLKRVEDPCEITGGSCDWIWDDGEDQDGQYILWDVYCNECYRSRDFRLDTYEEKQ